MAENVCGKLQNVDPEHVNKMFPESIQQPICVCCSDILYSFFIFMCGHSQLLVQVRERSLSCFNTEELHSDLKHEKQCVN